MAFGFDKNTKDSSAIPLRAGVNRHSKISPELANVDTFITGIEYCPPEDNSSASLKITMTDSDNRISEFKLFDPSVGEYASDKNVAKFNKIIANLCRKFLGAEYAIPVVDSFEEYCNRIIRDIGTRYQGVALRTFIVYNRKGFVKLRGYAPIWELASVPESESEMIFNEKFDLLENPSQPAARKPVDMNDVFGEAPATPEKDPFSNDQNTI